MLATAQSAKTTAVSEDESPEADLQMLEPALLKLFEVAASLKSAGSGSLIGNYRNQVVELGELAQRQQLRGVARVASLFDRGLQKLIAGQRDLNDAEAAVMVDWPAHMLAEVLGGERLDPHAPWAVLNTLRGNAWFPEIPEHFLSLIQNWLAEDARRFVTGRAQPNSAFADSAAFAAECLPVLHEVVDQADDVQVWDNYIGGSVTTPVNVDANVNAVDLAMSELSPDNRMAGGLATTVAITEFINDDPTEPSKVAVEELDMLGEALRGLQEEFAPVFQSSTPAEMMGAFLEQYTEQLEHILNATAHLGMPGLQKVIEIIQVNSVSLQMAPQAITAAQQSLLAEWPSAALGYLEAPNTLAAAQALAAIAGNPLWLHPVSRDVLPQWASLLNAVEVVLARADTSRATVALPEHVELSVPGDIDRSVLNSLLAELPQHAQRFSALVQSLAQGGSLEDMDQARRVAHTLKGAGSTVGIKGVANLTHVLEDILVAFDRQKRLPTHALRETLIEAADCLEAMSESLVGETTAPPESLAVYQKVLDWANHIDTEGLPEEDAPVPVAVALEAATPARVATTVGSDAMDIGASEPAPAEEFESYLRVPASLIDSLLKLSSENAIITSQLQDRVTRLSADLYAQRTGSRHIRQLSSELEQLVDVRGMAMLSGGTGELDALEMDQYNELHMLSRRIMESAADSQEFSRAFDREIASFRDLMAAKERTQLEIQRSIQRTRMVEVASIAPRLQRTVRQAARVLEKSVTLVVRGETTLVDTQLLNRIMDPLMHMLRNAVDHGIEFAKDRQAVGKPATGTITLTFGAAGSNFAVRCEDDGRGLNLHGIRAKAIQSGLIHSDDAMSDAQIMRLTMLPGFSTREQATLISGRGVGMDVVQRTVTDLRGMLDMHSEAGLGARFNMAFPVQLSATQVMISRSSRHLLAISERSVEQLAPLGDNYQRQPDGSFVYVLNGDRIPAIRLETLLGLPSRALSLPGVIEIVMIVFDENRQRHAVVIPEASDSRNVVVKPFSSVLPRMIGVDGATIMGDGAVAVVIDLPDLLRSHRAGDIAAPIAADAMPAVLLPLCLIVDDSVSVRRTMEQLMQDAGYDVASARDGIEALGELQKRTPDVVLVDLEMPRMNGLQFTNALRNQAATKNTPVVMITSRFTEKHQQLAIEAGVDAFLTKPYAEEQLLNTILDLLREKSSLVQDSVAARD